MDENKILKDAQYRKNFSIAFFNAANVSVEMIKLEGKVYKGKGKSKKLVAHEDRFVYYQDLMLKRYRKYYAEVISATGANYKVDKTIEKILQADTREKLNSVWLGLSQEERQDPAIKKVVKELILKYKNDIKKNKEAGE